MLFLKKVNSAPDLIKEMFTDPPRLCIYHRPETNNADRRCQYQGKGMEVEVLLQNYICIELPQIVISMNVSTITHSPGSHRTPVM